MNAKNKILFKFLALFIVACDVLKPESGVLLESRTMIIGGVPVHDKDYKLQQDQGVINLDSR